MSHIECNLQDIRERISLAAQRDNRSYDDVTLVAVTKTVSCEDISEALRHGVTDIGENRVQELCGKFGYVKPHRWHLIGHLQSNKIKYIIDKVDLIHSVDSIKLIEEINKQAKRIDKTQNVLVQINVSGEESKFGAPLDVYEEIFEKAIKMDNVFVKGIMTIAPNITDNNRLKEIFLQTREIFLDICRKQGDNIEMDILSMGMTGDFETAIECGSNMVRIGSGIFKAQTKDFY